MRIKSFSDPATISPLLIKRYAALNVLDQVQATFVLYSARVSVEECNSLKDNLHGHDLCLEIGQGRLLHISFQFCVCIHFLSSFDAKQILLFKERRELDDERVDNHSTSVSISDFIIYKSLY